MVSATRTFLLDEQPEVFPTSTEISAPLRRAVVAGQARRLGGRLYTRNVDEPLEQVALRNWQRIAAHHFPGAVVADRSAFEAKPSADGSLFLDAGPDYAAKRPVRLPGLVLRPRKGPGPLPGDMPYMGLHIASRARALLDNMRPSRRRDGVSRTYSQAELEDELLRLAELRGEAALNELRDQARELAPQLGAEREMAAVDELVGAVLGTRDAPLATPAARARRAGLAFDRRRIDLFAALQAELLRTPLPSRAAQPSSWPTLSFLEAYFSNWIEGTEFEIGEAEEIVFKRRIPRSRIEDAHDILGTFELVDDPRRRSELPASPESLLDLLRAHYARMLERRPEINPGSFQERANRAGGTAFVEPSLLVGTLTEGYRFLEPLPAGLARAIFMMYLIAEVHPFTDGNGRVARVLMNAELTAAGEQRIVIPLSFRDDYLRALRALSRGGDPRPLVRVLDFAQRYAAAIDWSELRRAERMLERTNAFVTPDVAAEENVRLVLPEDAGP